MLDPKAQEIVDADFKEIPDVSEEQKDYFPPVSNADFVMQCLGAAWNVVTDGMINIMKSEELDEEGRKTAIVNLLAPLRNAHIKTVAHTHEFVENFEYHVLQERNLDNVVEFILRNGIIGIRNNFSAIPREALAEREPETDKDPNWRYDALPVERIFKGERIAIKAQTNRETIYGWYECLNHQVINPKDPTKVINVATTVPCVRVKAGNVAINAIWRWQEISPERLKLHWLKGESMLPSVKQNAKANPIDKSTETEGTDHGNTNPCEPSNV